MTKDEAHREVLKRWHALPLASRKTFDDALAFAKVLDAAIQFETLGIKSRIIEAWLIRDLQSPLGSLKPTPNTRERA